MFEDLTGQTFGKLTVLSRDLETNKKHTYWICQCSCEKQTIKSIRGTHLKSGRIKSCGCLYKERKRSNVPPNIFKYKKQYKIGITDTGKEFYYDICDAELIEKYSWYFDKDGYVVARIGNKNIKIHKLITNTDEATKVDHKNLLKFDNRRDNLRIVTDSQNSMNIPVKSNNTSGVTGVGWHKKYEKWRARITINKKQIILGYFSNFDDAVKARKEAEIKYFGEFAPQ